MYCQYTGVPGADKVPLLLSHLAKLVVFPCHPNFILLLTNLPVYVSPIDIMPIVLRALHAFICFHVLEDIKYAAGEVRIYNHALL